MDALPLNCLSEFGMDYALAKGRFNALDDGSHAEFHDYWWREICRFESFLLAEFPKCPIFISDHVPARKSFCLTPPNHLPFDLLCKRLMAYLVESHPDASVVIAKPFECQMPASAIVLTRDGLWVDRDSLSWLHTKVNDSELLTASLRELAALSVSTRQVLPWLAGMNAAEMPRAEFWAKVYSNSDFKTMGKSERQNAKGYELGSEIVTLLTDKYQILDSSESCDVYVSGSLGSHRVIKVECDQKICTREFVEDVWRMVTGVDGTWGVRFAVHGGLIQDNSYSGGIVITPRGNLILEGVS